MKKLPKSPELPKSGKLKNEYPGDESRKSIFSGDERGWVAGLEDQAIAGKVLYRRDRISKSRFLGQGPRNDNLICEQFTNLYGPTSISVYQRHQRQGFSCVRIEGSLTSSAQV